MGFFVVLQQVVEIRQDLATASEISHEVGLQLGEIGR
jgi:hypothetical protein